MKKSLLVLGLLPLLVGCNRTNTSSEKPADSTPKQSQTLLRKVRRLLKLLNSQKKLVLLSSKQNFLRISNGQRNIQDSLDPKAVLTSSSKTKMDLSKLLMVIMSLIFIREVPLFLTPSHPIKRLKLNFIGEFLANSLIIKVIT